MSVLPPLFNEKGEKILDFTKAGDEKNKDEILSIVGFDKDKFEPVLGDKMKKDPISSKPILGYTSDGKPVLGFDEAGRPVHSISDKGE